MRRISILLAGLLLVVAVQAASDNLAEQHLRRGRELYDFGRWVDARHAFLEAQRLLLPTDLSSNEEVAYYLAACAVELGSKDAEQALHNFMRDYPGSTHNNEVRLALGSYYCAQGNMERARTAFEACDYKALSPTQRERYNLRMGHAAFSERNYSEAYAYFNRLDSEGPYADHATYYRAYIDYAEERLPQAKEGFTSLVKSEAYGELAPYYLLQIEFREGNYPYVVEHGEQLVARAVGERKGELERVLAEAWFHLENYERSLEHLDRYRAAVETTDRDTDYLYGFSLYRLARYDEAEPWLRKACGPDDALTQNASYHLADCYLRLGRKREAMQAFALATDQAHDAAIAEDALFNYAKLQYELGGGLFNGAIQQLNRYVQSYPNSKRLPEARQLLIAAYYNSRDYDAAYRAIKSMPAADSELRTALQKIVYFRGLEAYKSGDHAAARSYLNEAATLQVSPRYTSLAGFWLGELDYAAGDYEQAANRYEAYIRRAPRGEREYRFAWYNLGYCHLNEGRTGEAERALNNFLASYTTRDRYRNDALNRLGDAAYAERRFDAAVAHYEQVVAAGSAGSDYAAFKRAQTLGVLGQTSRQQQALRQIIKTGKGAYLEDASYELGASHMRAAQYREAATQYEQFMSSYPNSTHGVQVWKELGLAYLNLGENEQALKAYERVVEAAPQSQTGREALQAIREIYLTEGNAEGYFAYAEGQGVEQDLSLLARDSLSFVAAQKLYLADRRDDAERSLRSYLKSYPKGSYRTDALSYLSECYLQAEKRQEAIPVLTELAELGATDYRLKALRTLSTLTWEEQRYPEAAVASRKLFDVSTDPAEREAAMTRYVRATLQTKDSEQISKMATDVISQKRAAGPTAWREAQFAWAEQLRTEGRTEAAHRLYKELAEEVTTREGSAAAYYLIEHDFKGGAGDLDATEKAIFALSERSPRAYWLAKAYLLLGDLYVSKGDPFQARATYQSVADGYSPADDGIVEEAKARIAKLNER